MSTIARLFLTVRRVERLASTVYATIPNFEIHKVVSVELEGFARVDLPNLGSGGPLSRTSATLDAEIAKRIVRFAWYGPLKHSGDYDCHSFIDYVCGWRDWLIMGRPAHFILSECTHAVTDIGQPYAICDENDVPTHSLLGWGPRYSLSVLGVLGPFAICSNENLLRAYGPRFCRLLNMH